MSEWHERMDWYMREACIRWIDKLRVTDWQDMFIGYGRHERMDWYMRQACIRWIDKWIVTDWKDMFIWYGRVSDMNAWTDTR